MKILADENVELEIINALREADSDVIAVRESLVGVADDELDPHGQFPRTDRSA